MRINNITKHPRFKYAYTWLVKDLPAGTTHQLAINLKLLHDSGHKQLKIKGNILSHLIVLFGLNDKSDTR